jgi:hypothetical protein
MRFIKTFILHLYLDSDHPNLLCGNLQSLPDRNPLAFKNKTDLLGLLEQCVTSEFTLARKAEKPLAHPGSENNQR